MSLAKLLENKFRGDIRHRGAAYVKAGRVSITKVTSDHIFAVVRDGSEHQTQLSRDDGELKMFCSSVEGTSKPPTTKYLWATILAVDEGGLSLIRTSTGEHPSASYPTRQNINGRMTNGSTGLMTWSTVAMRLRKVQSPQQVPVSKHSESVAIGKSSLESCEKTSVQGIHRMLIRNGTPKSSTKSIFRRVNKPKH